MCIRDSPREEARELMADTRGESLRRRLQRFVGDESAEAIAAVTGTSRFKGCLLYTSRCV